jgi:hypothetical protein
MNVHRIKDMTRYFWVGERIPVNTDVPLTEGWNLIAYYPTCQPDMSSPDYYALSPIIDHVEVAKDGDGNFMIPEFDFSNLPPWSAGQGYQVKVDADVILNYPDADR